MNGYLKRETWERVRGKYPFQFWVLVAGLGIDSLGAALFSTLFAIFLKSRFGVKNLDIGLIIVASVLASLATSPIAGTASDRIGRKKVLTLTLFLSGLSILGLAFANKLWEAAALLILDGLVSPLYGPAAETIISDVLPAEEYRDAYSILRVAKNLARMAGPALGGLLAEKSFTLLLLTDGATSIVFLLLVLLFVQETLTAAQRIAGKRTSYGRIFRHREFVTFASFYILAMVAQCQMTINTAVHLKENGLPMSYYGLLMTWVGLLVITLQIPIIKISKPHPANRLLALGALLGGISVWLAGLLPVVPSILLIPFTFYAFSVIFLGPVGSAYVAAIAPKGMRGRYMSLMPVLAGIGYAIGIPIVGRMMDVSHSRPAWWLMLAVGTLAAAGFLFLLPDALSCEEKDGD